MSDKHLKLPADSILILDKTSQLKRSLLESIDLEAGPEENSSYILIMPQNWKPPAGSSIVLDRSINVVPEHPDILAIILAPEENKDVTICEVCKKSVKFVS